MEEDDDIETDDFDPSFNNNNTKQDAELIAKSDSENLAARFVCFCKLLLRISTNLS